MDVGAESSAALEVILTVPKAFVSQEGQGCKHTMSKV